MSRTLTLKDANYSIIGYVELQNNGDKILKDKYYRIKGYYEARTDITKDEHYSIVGYGDILTMLLK